MNRFIVEQIDKIKQFKTKNKVILLLFAIVFIVVGFSSFIKAAIVATNFSLPLKTDEMLGLSDAGGIVVNDEGVIFCGSKGYSRVQAYDHNGKFIYSLKINSGGGAFNIKLKDNNLEVATVRTHKLIIFNSNGDLIRDEENSSSYNEFGKSNQHKFVDKKGNIYKIRNSIFYPNIARVSTDGNTVEIVTIPILIWIFTGPIPAWFFCAIGVLLWMTFLYSIGVLKYRKREPH